MAATLPTIRQRVLGATARIRRVKAIDRIATATITLGGLFIIAAVSFIFVFILGEALPLFRSARSAALAPLNTGDAVATPLLLGADEYQRYFYRLTSSGEIVFHRATDGAVAKTEAIAPLAGSRVVSASRSTLHDFIAVGTDDGRVALRQVVFEPRYEDQKLADVDISVADRGLFDADPQKRPIRSVAYDEVDGRKTAAAVVSDDEIAIVRSSDDGTDQKLSIKAEGGAALSHVRLGRGDTLVAATRAGDVLRYELLPEPRLTGSTRVANGEITALEFSLGGVSLLVGDAQGTVSAWFPVRKSEDDPDPTFVRAHEFPGTSGPVRAILASPRDKSFLTAAADGTLTLRHLTSERTLLTLAIQAPDTASVLLTPKMDAIYAQERDGRLARFRIESPHPEVSAMALLGRVWYEGYPKPEYVWQSTGGTDDFEAKFSLAPLVFGTLKGTLYALLFAVPLSILGALYTSQFMHPAIKSKVKPIVEIMAALPSVVIGFLAGLWLASRVERNVVAVLLMAVLLPIAGTAGLLFWRRLPVAVSRRLKPGMEVALILPLLVFGAFVALRIAPQVEAVLFHGDFQSWLKESLGLVYDQRNCLVVGLAMGFAVIPIIFTIAEDSFSAVPSHLTAASLALGASRWQTATRVVLPTASPGVFSAVMIGFGRAIGETMIVLMATGNTPLMEWSIFNGMRTLSANIAVEIPEAPYGGTLYRTLFLAALALFVMTFIVNTIAEVVRQRLRERYRVL